MTDQTTLQAIAALVPHGSRVLDLGCGEGQLLDYLRTERGCTGYGIEIDDYKVLCCVQRGVQVIQLNLTQYRSQSCLRKLRGGHQIIFYFYHRTIRIHHFEINHRIDFDCDIVSSNDILRRNIHRHRSQIHSKHSINQRYQ